MACKRGFSLKNAVMRCLKLKERLSYCQNLYSDVTSSSYPSQNVARMAQQIEKLPGERSND
jgi:hypothetical protein